MALINKLENLGDAVREKTGTTDLLTLDEMAEAIGGISAGPSETELTFSGRCSYLFADGGWNWFLNKYADQITFKDVTNADYMFQGMTQQVNAPYDKLGELTINLTNCDSMSSMFQSNAHNKTRHLSKLPKFVGTATKWNMVFGNCYFLMDDEVNKCGEDVTIASTSAQQWYMNGTFQSCYSLRNVDTYLTRLQNFMAAKKWSSPSFGYVFQYCTNLDSIGCFPVLANSSGAVTSGLFGQTWDYASRLKDMQFATNDGEPYVCQWKNQTITLSQYVGYYYPSYKNRATDFFAGITEGKEVTDDATYQALKDDPDWWTQDVAYSRYNHDSAVRTINSLPDTSAYLATAGGTNTIKFKGAAGSATDGGAINTLTEEEIAVATAKGWTVTLV